MQSYEKEQEKLQKYWQEILSGEDSSDNESLCGDVYLSDEYKPSDSDTDSEYESTALEQKRKRKCAAVNRECVVQTVPSPSREKENATFGNSVDEIIEFVIAQYSDNFETEIIEEETNEAIVWGQVNIENLQKFIFEDKHAAGFNAELYENFYDKSPLEFYKYFVDDALLSMMV